MRSFQIAPDLARDEETRDPITGLCLDAREIFTGYMEGPYPLEDGERPVPSAGAEDSSEGALIHQTTEIPINARQYVTLSNLPYVFSEGSDLRPVLDPGFVAFRAAPFPSEALPRRFGKDPMDDQLIFRMPSLGTRAAIFHGWEMIRQTEVTEGNTRKLDQIEKLLVFMRRSLRTQMLEDMDAYEATYLSKTPRPIGSNALSDFLDSVFGE